MSDPSPEASPDVSIVVPALNEADTIEEVIQRLLALPLSTQIIVVDDGSTDRTPEILKGFAEKITVVTHPHRRGKGTAIRSALAVARGKTLIVQDADLEYDPEEIPKLVGPILAGEGKVVYGTRFAHGMSAGMALPNKVVNKLLALATNVLYRQRISDEATCYKAVDRQLLERLELQCTGFEFCPEVTAKVSRAGESIREVPIGYHPRTKNAGKKIRWTDAPIAFWTLLRYRFWKPKVS